MRSLKYGAAVLLLAGSALSQAGQMPLPAYQRTYTATNAVRGFYVQAPVDFTIVGVRVPDEQKRGIQHAALYVLASKPGRSVTATPKFFDAGKSSKLIMPTNVTVKKGQWLVALGACGTGKPSYNSYGNGGPAAGWTNILGNKAQLFRVWTNSDFVGLKGAGAFNGSTGSIGRVELYIKGQPPLARAEDYGKGSTTKPFGNPYMPLPAFSRTYGDSRGYPRGFYFQAPARFIVTGFRVPNEGNHKQQTVLFCTMPAAPPQYSKSYALKAADVKYFKKNAPANTLLKVSPPAVINKGQWVGVLGTCTDATTRTQYSSYSAGGVFDSNILGNKVQLRRFLAQSNIGLSANGVGFPVAANGTFNHGRVQIHIIGQNAFPPFTVPELTTVGQPATGTTPKLDLTGKIPGVAGGIVFLGTGRIPPAKTPFGNLLVGLPVNLLFIVGGGNGQLPIPIPGDKGLWGKKVQWQGLVWNGSLDFGMTNGTEWMFGG